MGDYLKDESKVGAMLRYMTGDVALSMKQDLQELYSSPGIDPEVSRQCAKWHWLLVKYSQNPVAARKYISIIEYAFEYGIELESMETWKKTMRITLPEEFINKMANFSQVPQIAIMDDSHAERRQDYVKEMRDSSEVLW
jgi:hypothetical protein